MTKVDKILCCCSWGCNRSVHAKYILNLKGFDHVLACGLEHTDLNTLMMLGEWADVILVIGEPALMEQVPIPYRYKAKLVEVGPDRWGGWHRPELLSMVSSLLEPMVRA